jgi:cobalt-zinc-cadmium efflux system protein
MESTGSLDGEHHVLTAHVKAVLTQDLARYAQLKATLQSALETYDLAHTTIEIELAEEACRDQPVSSQMDPH